MRDDKNDCAFIYQSLMISGFNRKQLYFLLKFKEYKITPLIWPDRFNYFHPLDFISNLSYKVQSTGNFYLKKPLSITVKFCTMSSENLVHCTLTINY